MKLSIVNGERREPEKGLLGSCIGCGEQMIAKCGPIKIRHWAHKSNCECDHWWENETNWHRAWKNNFPIEWQEIRHKADDGEWHIADVKTGRGWILEFQNSPLKREEFQARNSFYRQIVWVVNGLRRMNDAKDFESSLRLMLSVNNSPLLQRVFVITPNDHAIFHEWQENPIPVFYDFGQENVLWCRLPYISGESDYILEFSRHAFVHLHKDVTNAKDVFMELMEQIRQVVTEYSAKEKRNSEIREHNQAVHRFFPLNRELRRRSRRF